MNDSSKSRAAHRSSAAAGCRPGHLSGPVCRSRRPAPRGAITILALMLVIVFLAGAAFSVDVAYMQLTRAELRTAADAAARAGTETLRRTKDPEAARASAREAARRNIVAGKPLRLSGRDIVLGHADRLDGGGWHFIAHAEPLNSMRVTARRTRDSADGAVPLFFGHIMGRDHFEPRMSSTVAQGDEGGKRDFALIIDRSGSMNWTAAGGRGSRWRSLLAALGGFFNALEDTEDEELVGLASYSSWSSVDQRLVHPYHPIGAILRRIRPRGATNIYAGIRNGTSILTDGRSREDATRIMIVMTDGRHNTGREPIDAAREAAQKGITVYSITFGNNADIRRMQMVAAVTGGKHYHAPTASALQEAFRQVVNDSAELTFAE